MLARTGIALVWCGIRAGAKIIDQREIRASAPPRPAHTQPRSAVRLCTSAPPSPRPELTLGKLVPLLTASDAHLHLDGALEQKLRAAWDAGWREQAVEIEALGRDLAGTPDTENNALNLQKLLEASENKTDSTAGEARASSAKRSPTAVITKAVNVVRIQLSCLR